MVGYCIFPRCPSVCLSQVVSSDLRFSTNISLYLRNGAR